MSPTDFHVLLVLAGGMSYGYAILKAVEEESAGAVLIDIGSLYRVLARLVSSGIVEEAPSAGSDSEVYRGRPRRYYALTSRGRQALEAEAQRLASAVDISKARSLRGDPSRS